MSDQNQLYCLKCGKPLEVGLENGETRRLCADTSCKWVYYENPTPVVAALVERVAADGSSHVVLVRGINWPANWYGLVTGFLEKGEKMADGVVREVKEELGLDGKIVDFLGVFDFLRFNQIIIAYHVKVKDHTVPIKLQESELAGYREVPVHRLRPFPGPTGMAVAEFLKRRAHKLSKL